LAHGGFDFPHIGHVIPVFGGSRFHDLHHSQNRGNYGEMLTIWDEWFGTRVYRRDMEKEKERERVENNEISKTSNKDEKGKDRENEKERERKEKERERTKRSGTGDISLKE